MSLKTSRWFALIAFTLLGVTAVQTSGQVPAAPQPRYKLIDLGTFGGPNSSFAVPVPTLRLLNGMGGAVGGADTPILEPSGTCFNYDCYLSHAFRWHNGVATELDGLPGLNSSFPLWVSDSGLVAGVTENGIDPLTGQTALEAIVWKPDGSSTALGTLGGNSSIAIAVNDAGVVAGGALNTIPDPYAWFFLLNGATQIHATSWQNGKVLDLGTLGGPDSVAIFINNHGQVAGWSLTNETVAFFGLPVVHPFLWDHGKMTDLVGLGGSPAQAWGLNEQGQVVGTSWLAGDTAVHPFLWQSGAIKDLGTLGGDGGEAFAINNSGDVAGDADLPGSQTHHASLWSQGGMRDLGTLDQCSVAFALNDQRQVVGKSTDCNDNTLHPFLWDQGVLYDLNSLIVSGPDLTVFEPYYINNTGEIAALALTPDGNPRAVVLVPCGSPAVGGAACDGGQRTVATLSAQSSRNLRARTRSPLPVREAMQRQPRKF